MPCLLLGDCKNIYGHSADNGRVDKTYRNHILGSMFICIWLLPRRRLIHIGKVIYWSTPHSNRLNTICSDCCHAMTYIGGLRLSLVRMRFINSEPLMNGFTARTITKSGLFCMQVEIIWSGDEQHITFVESQPTISAMSAAAALR